METETWRTTERDYTLTADTFTKRELRRNEWFTNIKGKIVVPPFSRERMRNEYVTLDFIASNTTIPVPKVLEYIVQDDAATLVLERIDGETLDSFKGVEKDIAFENALVFLEETVLPQLRQLRSSKPGGLTGVVVPPYRVWKQDKREHWPVNVSASAEYVLCHCDLAQHNIMVDKETLQPVAIIDWEYSGFYPAYFEIPFWLKSFRERKEEDIEKDVNRLVHFLQDQAASHTTSATP